MRFATSMTVVDKILGSAPFVCEGSFLEGIAKAAELGFDGVEIHIANPAEVDTESLIQAAGERRIRITSIGTGRAYVNEGLSITDPDDIRRQAAVKRLEDFIRLGAKLDAIVIIGCMRGNISSPEELPRALELLAQSMVHLDRLAREQGVTLVFEPINRYENNFLCTVKEIYDFIRENKLTNTGILADTFHMNIEEPDILGSIREYGSLIRHVHIADSNRRYPGAGHLDFPAILRELDKAGYRGVLSAECLPLPEKEEAARQWLRAVLGMMDSV